MSDPNQYQNPLISRYASADMSRLWSAQRKFSTWRRLWLALAGAEQQLGLDISDEQLAEMERSVDDIDFALARDFERKTRHDVMAHVKTFGVKCPAAKPIIHLGATSCYVTDNTDLILIRESLELLRNRLVGVIDQLANFAVAQRSLPCLGFTHLQPAQPTTVGKRACLWAYDLVLDLTELTHRLDELRFRSAKGTTGTQASYLELFDGDHNRVRQLEQLVAERMGFDKSYAVCGQTYPRKLDSQVLDVLSGIAQSAHKMATDLRLLASRKEVEEPFAEGQIGSSAMAYKRNPMRSERVCSLARFVISLQSSPANTLATQWMERTLDDSANRRLVIPQAFLAIDAILLLLQNIATNMVVYPRVIARHLAAELPFMATEIILMRAVAAGGDRQELHDRINRHSQAAATRVKQEGADNDLLDRLDGDEAFANINVRELADPSHFIGRSAEQVDEFVRDVIEPIRQRYADLEDLGGDVTV